MTDPTQCSFCHKPRAEVKKLLQGGDGCICDECVGGCMIMLCGDGWIPPTVTLKVTSELVDSSAGTDEKRAHVTQHNGTVRVELRTDADGQGQSLEATRIGSQWGSVRVGDETVWEI